MTEQSYHTVSDEKQWLNRSGADGAPKNVKVKTGKNTVQTTGQIVT